MALFNKNKQNVRVGNTPDLGGLLGPTLQVCLKFLRIIQNNFILKKLNFQKIISPKYLNIHFIKTCYFLLTLTFTRPPTYTTWTIMDIWPTTHAPHLIHGVYE